MSIVTKAVARQRYSRGATAYGSLLSQGRRNHDASREASDFRRSSAAGVFGGAEMDVFGERGGYRGHLFAFGGAGDGKAGLVEGGLDASALRVQVVEQLGHQHAGLAVAVIGQLARRGRGQDQRIVGCRDRRQTMGEGAEPALIGV